MLKPFIKKTIDFNFSKQKLKFDVSQSLFSSYQIDIGTQNLLNTLRKNPSINYKSILDLGCGYGAMAIFLKKQNPSSNVCAVDRDVLAIEFVKHNAEKNKCEINAFPSLDYSAIKDKKFDLIVCNFPAKAGLNALKRFVYGSSEYLNEKGIFSLVIVKELEDDFKKILRDEIEIMYEERKAGYFIYHLTFNKKISFDEEPYLRNKVQFRLGKKVHNLITAKDVSEFESPSFSTEGILEIIKDISSKEVVILNPYQGHSALGVVQTIKPRKVSLVSRDLLSLEFSESNLKEYGFSNIVKVPTHYLNKKLGDLLVWNLEKEDYNLTKHKFDSTKKLYSNIILSGKKRVISRLEKEEKIKISKEVEKNGFKTILINLPTVNNS